MTGRERELRALTDAVRRLVRASVVSAPTADETARIAADVRRVADDLRTFVPTDAVVRYAGETDTAPNVHAGAPYDVIHGLYSPLAPPLRMSSQGRTAVGEVTFDTPYEGPPGFVHGAVLAGCFDMVLGAANRLEGPAGPTVRLFTRYRRPTRLHQPCRFEAEFDRLDGRRIHTVGRVVQNGEVTVECEGSFAHLTRERIDTLASRGASPRRDGREDRSPHLNQPGGAFRASGHPAVAGREVPLRALADSVRDLIELTVTHVADAAATVPLATRVNDLAAALERHEVVPPFSRYGGTELDGHPHDFFPFDPVLGLYNPLALPIRVEWNAPLATGRAWFTTPYEGPPGCVHGAVIAGGFDQVCNVANIRSGVAGPTRTLDVTYRRPTRLDREVVFEAWVESVQGRDVTTRAVIRQGDQVTCEAVGVFVALPGGTPPG